MFGYRDSMQEAYLAHKNFKDEWSNWRNGKLKKTKKSSGNLEPESVMNARNKFLQKLGVLYELKIYSLEKKFRDNPKSAIDELIEFLSVDIMAHRCGYAKEVFLKWLKNIELTSNEVEQFQQVAIKVCETDNIRREFRRWCRLMIKLADEEFILKLKQLLKSENHYSRIKSKWMIDLIQKHRADLRE